MLLQRDLRLLLGPLSLIVSSVRCLSWLLVLRAGIILAGCGARRNAQRDNLHWNCDSHPRPQLANRDILGVLPGVVWLVAIHSLPNDRLLILILLFLRVQHHRRHLRRPRIWPVFTWVLFSSHIGVKSVLLLRDLTSDSHVIFRVNLASVGADVLLRLSCLGCLFRGLAFFDRGTRCSHTVFLSVSSIKILT